MVAALLAGCGSFSSYAAEVNGDRISQNDLQRELNAILDNRAYLEQVDQGFASRSGERARGAGKNTFNTVFVAAVLDRRIGFELIHQEVERRKLKVSAAQRRETRQNLEQSYGKEVFGKFPKAYRDDLVRIFAEVTALQEALGESSLDAADIREFYEANPAAFAQTCVRHILVDSEEKAAAAKARIDAGEDFAAVARAVSSDNQGPGGGSAARGGDLGCLAQGSLVPEFETAMAGLAPGQVSGPVRTQFGFHILQVTERKTQTLEEATPQIRENLEQQSPDAVQAFVNEALAKAKIVVNPRYGKFVKSGPNPGVRAPKQLEGPTTTQPPPLPQPSQ